MSLVFFDMDKSLVRGVSSLILANLLGKHKEGRRLERLVKTGRITDEEFTLRMGGLANGATIYQLRAIYATMPFIGGIQETVEALKTMGMKTAIVTQGVGEFAGMMCRDFGFDFSYGSSTEWNDKGELRNFGPPFVTAEDKASYALELCGQLKFDPDDCYAVGDSPADIPIFHAVGNGIAINYRDELAGHATHCIRPCPDLTQILPLID